MNVGLEVIEFLEENISDNLTDLGLGGIFMDLNPKWRETKAKLNQWNYIKLKSLCTAEEITKKIKRPTTQWEIIFENHISNKGLIPQIYKEFMQLNSRKKND